MAKFFQHVIICLVFYPISLVQGMLPPPSPIDPSQNVFHRNESVRRRLDFDFNPSSNPHLQCPPSLESDDVLQRLVESFGDLHIEPSSGLTPLETLFPHSLPVHSVSSPVNGRKASGKIPYVGKVRKPRVLSPHLRPHLRRAISAKLPSGVMNLKGTRPPLPPITE